MGPMESEAYAEQMREGADGNDLSMQAFANSADEQPTEPGWYACWATDDRWDGQMRYRAWNHGLWWIPLTDGWISGRAGLYRWHGPVADVLGPAPDGTNPAPATPLVFTRLLHRKSTDS